MKNLLIVIISLLIPYVAFAEPISEATAYKTACKWFYGNASRSKAFTNYKVNKKTIANNVDHIFLFTNSNDEFVLVAGNDDTPQIIGYGEQCQDEIPANVVDFLKTLSKAYEKAEQTSPLLNGIHYKYTPPCAVEPFVKAVRTQEKPFNSKCPFYTDNNGKVSTEHCIVGCVATALEQLISYHKYPSCLQDTLFGWQTEHYNVDTILPNTPIDFYNILDEYKEGDYTQQQSDAVANLCYYCGIASHMSWGLSSSGASVSALVSPLEKAFGYKYVKHVAASDYSISNWHKLLYQELSHERPILYASYTTFLQGHAFVIDGMNQDGYYHVLWGYGHNYNGYFDLSILDTCEDPRELTTEGELVGFYTNQEALLLYPDSIDNQIDTLVHEARTKVDSIRFVRTPDTNRYLQAQIYVQNTSNDSVASTFLLMTYDPKDSTIYTTSEDIALAGATLAPHSSECLTAYCLLHKSGERVLTVFTDDSSFVYYDTIKVLSTSNPVLELKVEEEQITDNQYQLKLNVSNTSSVYWAGQQLIYCLFEGEETSDNWGMQHFSFLNLPPTQNTTDSVSFANLLPNTDYTLVIKSNWVSQIKLHFHTNNTEGIVPLRPNSGEKEYYSLQGFKLKNTPEKGVYILQENNKFRKIYLP